MSSYIVSVFANQKLSTLILLVRVLHNSVMRVSVHWYAAISIIIPAMTIYIV